MRLTLRTLLAYLDDTLPPTEALAIGRKVAESDHARELVDKIKRLPRKRGLATPSNGGENTPSNPNTVAEYLSDALSSEAVTEFESACLEQEVNLAEVAACHQILTLLLSEPARVPPTARMRMYELVKGPESLPNRKPGATAPVGGMVAEMPKLEHGDADAGLLLGLSPAAVGVRWAVALALTGLAVAAAWFAWPRGVIALAPPPADVVDAAPNPPEPTPKAGPEFTPVPVPSDLVLSGDVKKPDPVPTPVPTPTVETPKPDPSAIDPQRKVIGTLVSKDPVVLAEAVPGMWNRLTNGGPLSTAERVVCLPGYRAKCRLETNLIVELWANLPDQIPTGPLESAVTIHAPAPGNAADLTLHNGRLYLQTADPAGATVRVRTVNGVRDVRLADEKTEAVVEVSYQLARGLTPKAESPSTSTISWAATRGSATLSHPSSRIAVVVLKAGEGFGEGPGNPSAPVEIGKRLARQSVYPDAVAAAAAQKALAALAISAGPMDRVSVSLAEAVSGNSASLARVVVFAQGAIGDVNEVASAMLDPNRPAVRDAAATALRATLAENPDRSTRVAQAFTEKAGFTKAQAEMVLALLRGPDAMEEASADVLTRLVDGLTADTLPVRELSHRILLLDVDPEAVRNPGLLKFDATGPVEARESCQRQWRKRVAELTKSRDPSPLPNP